MGVRAWVRGGVGPRRRGSAAAWVRGGLGNFEGSPYLPILTDDDAEWIYRLQNLGEYYKILFVWARQNYERY